MKYLITNTKISGKPVNILINKGLIAEISDVSKQANANQETEIIDGTGTIALQGLVDLHTHLREPGKEDAETVLSGSMAAARGGFTAISAMANTSPVADTAGVVEQVYRLGQAANLAEVHPVGAVTKNLEGKELAEIGAMADSVAKVRVFSDDGNCVSDSLIMRRALEYVKKFNGVIAQHAQDPNLTIDSQMNEGVISSKLGLKGWPAVAEEAIIARDVLLADHVGSRLHVCHLTTAGGVEIIRWAKARGIQVTAEVTPHHLLLTDKYAESYDPIYKVNPPLRTESDVMAIREALAEGTIDIVATDHAPHQAEFKECEWQAAAFGMLGLETALPILWQTMIDSGLIDVEVLQQRMSSKPAEIAGYSNQGMSISKGNPANLTLFAPDKSWKVDRDLVLSKARNTPFHGMQFSGSVVATFFDGRPTWRANG
ncbi:MAG: dihydroorotase [Candidatus Nanopelagicaceae bacterium]